MEGVMMKNKEQYAVAVRKPNNEIEVKVDTYGEKSKLKLLRKIPFIRGVFNFVDSMVLGVKVLTYSTDFFEEEEESAGDTKKTTEETEASPGESGNEMIPKSDAECAATEEKKQGWFARHKESIAMGLTVSFSLVMSIAIFFCVPFFATEFFRKYITNREWAVALVEGLLRIGIFIGYVVLISLMKEIQRFFQYHGAEHKCINCIEHGMELNVANARKASKQHKRCGTSFLLIVMVISIIFLFFIRAENRWVRLGIRLALIPVIAGVSYEFIRLAGRTENKFVALLSKPGMWLQNLTTREPDDSMLEVAIASVEAVFDWRSFLEKENTEKIEK